MHLVSRADTQVTRIGVIGDIHGNHHALQVILTELESLDVDELVCLGDVAVLGPHPNQVIDLLRGQDIPTVCGNTDAWLVDGHQVPALPPDSPTSTAFVDWTRSELSSANLAWIDDLPLSIHRDLAGQRTSFCHGSPRHSDDIIVDLTASEVGEFGFDWIVGGHTHQQTRREIGSTTYLNPGSVGLPGVGPGHGIPIHQQPHWGEFAVIDVSSDIDLTFHRVELDIQHLLEGASATNMPEQFWWRSRWADEACEREGS